MFNLFNFDAEAAEITAFDIKPCFKWEEQRFIQFSLDGKSENLYNKLSQFLYFSGQQCSFKISPSLCFLPKLLVGDVLSFSQRDHKNKTITWQSIDRVHVTGSQNSNKII